MIFLFGKWTLYNQVARFLKEKIIHTNAQISRGKNICFTHSDYDEMYNSVPDCNQIVFYF